MRRGNGRYDFMRCADAGLRSARGKLHIAFLSLGPCRAGLKTPDRKPRHPSRAVCGVSRVGCLKSAKALRVRSSPLCAALGGNRRSVSKTARRSRCKRFPLFADGCGGRTVQSIDKNGNTFYSDRGPLGPLSQLVKEGGNKGGHDPALWRKKRERRMKRRKTSSGEGGVKAAF